MSQIFVTGDSYNTYLVAVIIPRPDTVLEWGNQRGREIRYEDACKSNDFKLDVLRDLEKIGRDAKRNGLEIIRNVHLSPIPFSVESETMTPTQKIKRYQARQMYNDEISKLYSSPLPKIKA